MATEAELESPRRDAGAPVLHAVDVSVRFGGVVALHDVSVEVRAGEVLGLIGPNGAGKTTLFDVLSGLRAPVERARGLRRSRHHPSRARRGGRARASGARSNASRCSGGSPSRRTCWSRWSGEAAGVGCSPTWSRHRPDVGASVRGGRAATRCSSCADSTRCAANRQGSCPSGGRAWSRWRRAIVDEPNVLLLDEPTSGLEEAETASLGASMQRVCRERDCAVVLVEHDVGFVMQHCDRIVVLNLGEVIASGTPDEIRGNAAVQEAYLGESKP